MRCWQFGLFLLFSLVSLDVWAQDLPDIERLLEGNDILNTEDGYEEMVDILSNLLMTPVNVNMAGFDSLKMLFLLSDSQIDQLLEFRKKYGNFLHINELLLVPGIGKKDLENIRSFITLGHPEVQDRWTVNNQNGKYPRAQVLVNQNLLQSDYLIEDGSFLRIQNVTLGYTFPKVSFLRSLRIYATAQNLLTITGYSGYNPEVNSQGQSNLQLGVDYNAYPTARSFILGVNIGF